MDLCFSNLFWCIQLESIEVILSMCGNVIAMMMKMLLWYIKEAAPLNYTPNINRLAFILNCEGLYVVQTCSDV